MTVEQTNFAIEVSRALIWQYDSAPKIRAMIEDKQAWVDVNVVQFWENWYRDVYDLRTANDFGLQVWASILGVVFAPAKEIPTLFFGFNPDAQNFSNGGFYPNLDSVLTTEQKRTILKLKYRYLTSDATLANIYDAVQTIFPTARVFDNLNMVIDVELIGVPTKSERYMLDNYDIIPKPAGVKMNYLFVQSYWTSESGETWTDEDGETWAAVYV